VQYQQYVQPTQHYVQQQVQPQVQYVQQQQPQIQYVQVAPQQVAAPVVQMAPVMTNTKYSATIDGKASVVTITGVSTATTTTTGVTAANCRKLAPTDDLAANCLAAELQLKREADLLDVFESNPKNAAGAGTGLNKKTCNALDAKAADVGTLSRAKLLIKKQGELCQDNGFATNVANAPAADIM